MTSSPLLQSDNSLSSSLCDNSGGQYKETASEAWLRDKNCDVANVNYKRKGKNYGN